MTKLDSHLLDSISGLGIDGFMDSYMAGMRARIGLTEEIPPLDEGTERAVRYMVKHLLAAVALGLVKPDLR